MRFAVTPLSENIGHRASFYMEEYRLTIAMSMADAQVAATAIENHHTLVTGNEKLYKAIRDLLIQRFRS